MKAIRFIGILCLTILNLSACKKSEVKPELDDFDFAQIHEYYMVIKHFEKNNATHATPHLIQFFANSNQSIGFNDWFYKKNEQGAGISLLKIGNVEYDNNTFYFYKNLPSSFSLQYNRGELKSIESPNELQAKLIKNPASNPFAGKTFVGNITRKMVRSYMSLFSINSTKTLSVYRRV